MALGAMADKRSRKLMHFAQLAVSPYALGGIARTNRQFSGHALFQASPRPLARLPRRSMREHLPRERVALPWA